MIKMDLKDLVGKYAIRTAPCMRGDYSYMEEPVKVVYCDSYNAVIEHLDFFLKGMQSVLHVGWLDDEWRECPIEILNAINQKGRCEKNAED